MSRQKKREKKVKVKLAGLHEINKRIIEVEKSIEELRAHHEELVKQRFGIRTEIRSLGGKVPIRNEHASEAILWHLRDRKMSSDLDCADCAECQERIVKRE